MHNVVCARPDRRPVRARFFPSDYRFRLDIIVVIITVIGDDVCVCAVKYACVFVSKFFPAESRGRG